MLLRIALILAVQNRAGRLCIHIDINTVEMLQSFVTFKKISIDINNIDSRTIVILGIVCVDSYTRFFVLKQWVFTVY